jgi:hypothetical protein
LVVASSSFDWGPLPEDIVTLNTGDSLPDG